MSITRTRFAPSPTGFIHIGNVRTALFAWLVAKHNNGQFILRIEDTDKVREVARSEEHIKDSLKWLGLNWDEGPDIGGEYAPYKQSLRLDIYKQWAEKLIESGRAYTDPYSMEELEAFRDQAKLAKQPFLFRNHRPEKFEKWDGTKPLRFKSDPKSYHWNDLVMGQLSSGPESIDDFILMKSDGYPTYNFCHLIDDLLMKITHVIRSQEYISSVPKYLNLYEALEITPPLMATVPFVMAPNGRKKIGKRDGAKDILDYKRQGFLPESLINMMVLLGWNDGSTQEFFTVDELVEKFDLLRVQKSGAIFDEDRLIWINGHYIRNTSDADLYQKAKDFFPTKADGFDQKYQTAVLGLIKERLKFFAEIPNLANFFFEDLPINLALISDNKVLKDLDKKLIVDLLKAAVSTLESSDFSVDDLTNKLNQLLATTSQPPKILFSLIRIATTQAPASPLLAETMNLLGKELSLKRIGQLITRLSAV
jgi:glutamyl-tRNA synthetase